MCWKYEIKIKEAGIGPLKKFRRNFESQICSNEDDLILAAKYQNGF